MFDLVFPFCVLTSNKRIRIDGESITTPKHQLTPAGQGREGDAAGRHQGVGVEGVDPAGHGAALLCVV